MTNKHRSLHSGARRHWLRGAAGLGLAGLAGAPLLSGCASSTALPARTRVLVVGGGYGGATAAKYLRLFSGNRLDVVLVEPDAAFVSCPVSNLVLGGSRSIGEMTVPSDALASRHGVRVARDTVASIDPAKKTATLASGTTIAWDKLVLSPGVDLMWDSIAGL